LFDSTLDVEKLLSFGPISFDYLDTLNKSGALEITLISGPVIESEAVHEISRWLNKRKISHMRVLDNSHYAVIIHKDSLITFLNIIKPTEFDKLWDDVSELVSTLKK